MWQPISTDEEAYSIWIMSAVLLTLNSVMVEEAGASADKLYCVGSSDVVSPHCICNVPAQMKGLAEPTHSDSKKKN